MLRVGSPYAPWLLVLSAAGSIACSDGPTEPGDIEFADVTAGLEHTCALTTDGRAYCWGSNLFGELGTGDDAPTVRPFAPVAGRLRFTSLTAGAHHTCGIASGGTAYCWGLNVDGQLGDGTATNASTPVRIPSLTFSSIRAGGFHTCGRATTGVVYCWGLNDYGQLGDGTVGSRSGPTPVSGGHSFISIEGSDAHSCALTTAGAAYCWGADDGRLGDGFVDGEIIPFPSPVNTNIALSSLGAAHGAHVCGLTGSGAAYCWGLNTNGELGAGSTTAQLGAVAVAGGHVFQTIVAGGATYSCGLTTAGTVLCWGANNYSQLGDGTTMPRLAPTPISSDVTFKALAAGLAHTCAVSTTGEIYCWGANDYGQIDSDLPTRVGTPVRLGG